MEAIQEAIRRALRKGDAQDRAFREKVYRQALSALDRSFQARTDLSDEEIRQRREQVKATIVGIEREFRRAPSGSSAPPQEEPATAAPVDDFVPRVERGDRLEAAESFERERAGEPPVYRERRGRGLPFARLLVWALLIAAVGIGGWWAYQAGPRLPGASPVTEGLNSGNQPPVRLTAGAQSANGDWMNIFSPNDPTTVTAPAGASAEVQQGAEGSFLRISAPDAAVSFDVGQGVLERLAGKRAVFSLTARVAEGDEGQISISCNFGALGGCGRTRYVVGSQPAEYLFEVDLPDQRPSSGGTIAIVPDIEGRGRMLDVFSLQAAVAQN